MNRPTAVLIVAAALIIQAPAFAAAPTVGRTVPPLTGSTFTGQAVNLTALRGRVVVLNFWATWCAPCREEMPVIDAFSRRYGPRGVTVIGVSTDKAQALPLAQRIMGEFSYPAILGAAAQVNGFSMPPTVPITLIIGPDGVVRDIVTGEGGLLTEHRLAALVEPLLPRMPYRP